MYKIVQVLPALSWGGAQVFCIQLCNEFSKKNNYEVTLISLYHYMAEKHLPLSMLDGKVKFISLGKKPGIDIKLFSRIHNTLKQIQPDVVHTHLHAVYYCLYAYKRLKNPFKKIHTLHNLAKKDAPWYGRLLLKYLFKNKIVEAVTISEAVYNSAVAKYGDCIKTLIYNGTIEAKPSPAFAETTAKINALKKNAQTKVLLNVARITKQKNQKLLLDVMHELKAQNIITIIIGNYVDKDKNIYHELMANKPSNVYFMANVTNVSDYLLNADAFVLTSMYEGLPVSLLEALSAGTIPVCTPVGGIKNVVTKNIGFLSKNVSKKAFYKALLLYFDTDEAGIKHLKSNGKEVFNRKFSIHACALSYDALYHSL